MTNAQDNRPRRTGPRDRPSAMTGTGGLAAVVVSVAVLAAAAGAVWAVSLERPEDRQAPDAGIPTEEPSPSQSDAGAGPVHLDPAGALAVVERTHPELMPENGGPLRYETLTVLALGEQTVLIASGAGEEALPTVVGSLGIFYLQPTENDHRVVGSWPALTIGAPMGRPPEFEVTSEFGLRPVLVVSARAVRGGRACELLQLVELGPSGPVASEPFVSAFDTRGAEGPSGRVWSARIRDIVPDESFTLETDKGDVLFVKVGSRYVPAPGSKVPHC